MENNKDISHVKNDLTQILTYFRDCFTFSPDDPAIEKHIRDIREQGKEFHTCLQKSIIQSNNLEINAKSAIKCLESIDNQKSLDANHVSDALKILSENAQQNEEKTQKLVESFNSIKDKLGEINDKYIKRKIEDKERLQSLKDEKEELEENLKSQWWWIFSIGIILAAILYLLYTGAPVQIFSVPVVVIVIWLLKILYDRRNMNFDLRKKKRETDRLEKIEELMKSSEKDFVGLKEVHNKSDTIINQIGYFNIYWGNQHLLLGQLNPSDLESFSDQSRKLLMVPIKSKWEELNKLCNDYTTSVRKIVTDVHNGNVRELRDDVHNENMKEDFE